MGIEKVYKNLMAEKIINREFIKGNLSHAFLFVSNDTLLLKAYSLHVAERILAEDDDNKLEITRRLIEANSHPDLHSFPKEDRKRILVSDVEDLLSKVYFLPFVSTKTVFILNLIENMNESAQNKLLKILEEPPENVHFILTATKVESALSTIRSRSEIILIDNLSSADIYEAISDSPYSVEKLKLASVLSNGQLSKAYDLLEKEDSYEIINQSINIIENLNSAKDMINILEIVSNFNEVDIFYGMISIYRDMLLLLNNKEDMIININNVEKIKNLCKSFNICSIIESIDKVEDSIYRLNNFASKGNNIDTLLIQLLEVKYNCIQ